MNPKTNEDIVQEALVVMYNQYKQLDLNSILPYAYGVLDNLSRNASKTEIRRRLLLMENDTKYQEIFGENPSIEDALNYHELTDEIWHALDHLSDKEKELMKLKLEGFSTEEIEKSSGLSRRLIYVKMFRAIKKLRQILKRRGFII